MQIASATDLTRASAGIRRYLRGCVRIDTRALAAFRILAALLILADLALRARNFTHFYTDAGVVPRSVARAAMPVDVPSIYFLSTDPAVTAALFVVHGLVAVALLVGYRTRIAAVLAFAFVLSLDLRNPYVLSYADTLFAWLLFWSLFLPLGERWSIDAVHADRERRRAVANPASALLLLQPVTMYVVNAYHKSSSDLWTSGEAAALVLGLDDMTYLLAGLARSAPELLQVGGLVWFGMLSVAWLLPLLRGRARTLFVAAFVGVHLSFALTVRIGAFAFVAIAGLLPFLQAHVWDDLEALSRRLEFPLERTVERLRAAGAAVPRPGPDVDVPGRIRRNPRESVLAVGVAVLSVVLFASLLSAGGLVQSDVDPVDGAERGATAFVSHQTEWSVFAPVPRTTDRYYVLAAETESGAQFDVYNDRELTFDRPDDELQTQYSTYRERFYMNSVRTGDPPAVRAALTDHHCSAWDGEDDLVGIDAYVVEEDVTVETIDSPADRERTVDLLYEHDCDVDPATESS